MSLSSLITLPGIFGSNFSSSFNAGYNNVHSKRKFGLCSFDILPLIAFKGGLSARMT